MKWFIDEEYSDKAREIKKGYAGGSLNLVTPRLLEYEFTNALRFHPIVRLSRREIFRAILEVRRLAIMIDPSERTWGKAVELSLSEGISVYDAVYVALANTSDGRMVTSDSALLEKLSEGSRKNLILLKDLDLKELV